MKQKLQRIEEIQKIAIEIAMQTVKDGDGTLIVIGGKPKFQSHFPNFFASGKKMSVFDQGMQTVLQKLSEVDGAIVINEQGIIKAYGVRLTNQKTLPGKGTRHSAAVGASKQKSISILGSEEDKVVKIFKQGKEIMQINPHTKGVENHLDRIVRAINKPESAIIAGGAIAGAIAGIAILPGIVIFTGSVFVARKVMDLAKEKYESKN